MAIINLRKHYYPLYTKDTFIEVPDEVAAVMEECRLYLTSSFDRPAFKEMMQDITEGKINCVIVKDLSRLGREYIETGRYLRRVFPAYGVRFIAINDTLDTANDDSGDDLTQVLEITQPLGREEAISRASRSDSPACFLHG